MRVSQKKEALRHFGMCKGDKWIIGLILRDHHVNMVNLPRLSWQGLAVALEAARTHPPQDGSPKEFSRKGLQNNGKAASSARLHSLSCKLPRTQNTIHHEVTALVTLVLADGGNAARIKIVGMHSTVRMQAPGKGKSRESYHSCLDVAS